MPAVRATGICRSFKDHRDLMVIEPGNDWSIHDTDRHACFRELFYCVKSFETPLAVRGSIFLRSSSLSVVIEM